MTHIFETKVVGVGRDVSSFAELGMYVLFGENAPPALADYCYTIAMTATAEDILPGQRLILDGTPHAVTAVGTLVRRNLDGLGHITINFDGATEPSLEGTLHVAGPAPTIEVGATIAIEN